ncbi:hypothetical protein BTVI_42951 [Pitangus sulphuratus]|nr:hypothetical protein BTVI_42951 [Pitangus sulphuratus]
MPVDPRGAEGLGGSFQARFQREEAPRWEFHKILRHLQRASSKEFPPRPAEVGAGDPPKVTMEEEGRTGMSWRNGNAFPASEVTPGRHKSTEKRDAEELPTGACRGFPTHCPWREADPVGFETTGGYLRALECPRCHRDRLRKNLPVGTFPRRLPPGQADIPDIPDIPESLSGGFDL